jgi:large subunit ribosomal protein L13
MKVYDGKGIVMGRIASLVAKEALKGETIAIINCNEIIITGNRKMVQEQFHEMTQKVGSVQKGPNIHSSSDKIVKRAIRGMLPNHRMGRGREAFKRIKCYVGMPAELEKEKITSLQKVKKIKSITVKELARK